MTVHSTHRTQAYIAEVGKSKKQLILTDLMFIRFGAIFGSDWLFAANHVTSIAGPADITSWTIGGIAVLLPEVVYCELGAALSRTGGIVRYPVFSHGGLTECLLGFTTLITFSSLTSVETIAARRYATAWFPTLAQTGSGDPAPLRWIV